MLGCLPTELLTSIATHLGEPLAFFRACKATSYAAKDNSLAIVKWLLNTQGLDAPGRFISLRGLSSYPEPQKLLMLDHLLKGLDLLFEKEARSREPDDEFAYGNKQVELIKKQQAALNVLLMHFSGQASVYGMAPVHLLLNHGARFGDDTAAKELLLQCVRSTHIPMMELMAEKCSPSWFENRRDEALAHAAARGLHESFEALLRLGANPAGRNGLAFVLSAWHGELEMVHRIISLCGPGIARVRMDWALCAASGQGHVLIVKELLDLGCNPNTLEGTPLLEAATKGWCECIEVLIANGADVHMRNDKALANAVANNQLAAAQLLVEHGSDARACADEGLLEAAEKGHVDTVRFILTAGADPNAGEGQALFRACLRGHVDVVKLLLEAGADLSLRPEALPDAARFGRYEVVSVLLQAGAPGKEQALVLAAQHSNKSVANKLMQLLLQKGANPNTQDGLALAAAVQQSNEEAVEMLLQAGAAAGLAMHKASAYQNKSVLRLLLQSGADPSSLLHEAARINDAALVGLCLSHLDARAVSGSSATAIKAALETALEHSSANVVQALLEAGAGVHAEAVLANIKVVVIPTEDEAKKPSMSLRMIARAKKYERYRRALPTNQATNSASTATTATGSSSGTSSSGSGSGSGSGSATASEDEQTVATPADNELASLFVEPEVIPAQVVERLVPPADAGAAGRSRVPEGMRSRPGLLLNSASGRRAVSLLIAEYLRNRGSTAAAGPSNAPAAGPSTSAGAGAQAPTPSGAGAAPSDAPLPTLNSLGTAVIFEQAGVPDLSANPSSSGAAGLGGPGPAGGEAGPAGALDHMAGADEVVAALLRYRASLFPGNRAYGTKLRSLLGSDGCDAASTKLRAVVEEFVIKGCPAQLLQALEQAGKQALSKLNSTCLTKKHGLPELQDSRQAGTSLLRRMRMASLADMVGQEEDPCASSAAAAINMALLEEPEDAPGFSDRTLEGRLRHAALRGRRSARQQQQQELHAQAQGPGEQGEGPGLGGAAAAAAAGPSSDGAAGGSGGAGPSTSTRGARGSGEAGPSSGRAGRTCRKGEPGKRPRVRFADSGPEHQQEPAEHPAGAGSEAEAGPSSERQQGWRQRHQLRSWMQQLQHMQSSQEEEQEQGEATAPQEAQQHEQDGPGPQPKKRPSK